MSGKAKHPQFAALFNGQGPRYGLTNGFLRADFWNDAEHCYQNSLHFILTVCMDETFEIVSPFIQIFFSELLCNI